MKGSQGENFVRRNLKKKNFSYKKSRKRSGDKTGHQHSSKYRRYNQTNASSINDDAENDQLPRAKGSVGFGIDSMAYSLSSTKVSKTNKSQPLELSSFRKLLLKAHWSKSVDDIMLAALEQLAPNCGGHSMSAKLLTVKKSGGNKGRRFYACCFPADQRCNFFLWAEDNPELINSSLQESNQDLAVDYCLSLYEYKLSQLSRESLTREVQRFRLRREANELEKSHPTGKAKKRESVSLKVSGSRQEITQLLCSEAHFWIEQSHARFKSLYIFHNVCLAVNDVDNVTTKKNSLSSTIGGLTTVEGGEDEEEMILLSDSENEREEEKMILLSDSEDNSEEESGRAADAEKENQVNAIDTGGVEDGEYSNDELVDSDDDSLVLLEESDAEEFADDANDHLIAAADKTVTASNACDEMSINNLAGWFYGYKKIKVAQKTVIERVLAGKNTLAVLPTGYGKSLCYILPSATLPGVTIVISPLISLIRDQSFKLPCELGYANFSGSLGSAQCKQLVDTVLQGFVKVIFVSPERFCSKSFAQFMQTLQQKYEVALKNKDTSVVSLLCIDEAHCVTQWSHLFRASYLHIPFVVKKIRPHVVLALTATASLAVQRDICLSLGINEVTGIVEDLSVRDNIAISFELHEDECSRKGRILSALTDEALLTKQSKVKKTDKNALTCNSIVYVHRRKDCDELNEHLAVINHVKNVQIYHAGLQGSDKERVQKNYQHSHENRCIIATIAFGMGVDKADIHQVIHATLPRSLEGYVQEIGRAGRDVHSTARALAFYNPLDAIVHSQLVFKSQVTFLQILRLLNLIIPSTLYRDSVAGNLLALTSSDATKKLDVSEALIETVVCMLQDQNVLQIENFSELEIVQIKWKVQKHSLLQIMQNSKDKTTDEEKVLYAIARKYIDSKPSQEIKDQNTVQNVYATQHPFSISRSDICKKSNVPRDSVNYCLYKLQQQSLLEYSLHSSAIVYKITSRPSDVSLEYTTWLAEKARLITNELQNILQKASENALGMYKLAVTLDTAKCNDGLKVNTVDKQKFIQYLLAVSGSEDSSLDVKREVQQKVQIEEEKLKVLLESYAASPNPFPISKTSPQELKEVTKQLCKDADILKLCKHIVNTEGELSACLSSTAKKEILSQYIAFVLIGLSTELLHAYPMKDHRYSGNVPTNRYDNIYGDSDYEQEPARSSITNSDEVKICVEFNPFLKACFGKYKCKIPFKQLYDDILCILNQSYAY